MSDEILTPEEILSRRFVSSANSVQIVTGFQRYERPVYDHDAKFAPCRAGCPTGHDIATALFLLSQGRPELAHEVFRADSPFPAVTGRVCYHPCESVCNRGSHDQPLAINALERALAEYGPLAPEAPAPIQSDKTVGVIGAGPAGIACAYHVRRLGYAVTVYEANELPGGVLQYGIPPYRLPREVLARELTSLRKVGLEFRLGTRIGEHIGFGELRQKHEALFVAVGLGRPRALDVVAGSMDCVDSGVAFLRAVSEGAAKRVSGTIAVIGGGDVAVDAARSARRLGATRVTLCCLESRRDMPAHAEEVEAALREGIEIINGVVPTAVEGGPAKAVVTLARVRNVGRRPDGSMKWSLSSGTLEPLPAARVLCCLGQEPDCQFLPAECWENGRVAVDAFGQTRLPGVFAGGDLVGLYNVVNALGSAKRAVVGIDSYLRGADSGQALPSIRLGDQGAFSMEAYRQWRAGAENLPSATEQVEVADINLDYFPKAPRPHLPRLPRLHESQQDGSFSEVNLTLVEMQALAEAKRCFHCGLCNMCGNCLVFCPDSSVLPRDDWGFDIDLDHCKGCGVCVEECPRDAMSMVPEHEVRDDGSDQPHD
ncbi:MAG: hypothetical protein AUJ96_02300 [Armatimonadetes bacterium CG2_30_66_41]|nr:MAG: hypothetical protein AUJ96_02300 [Armatimonadetes bacterium CG2_30_66_41]